jgi:hypothetical protein
VPKSGRPTHAITPASASEARSPPDNAEAGAGDGAVHG